MKFEFHLEEVSQQKFPIDAIVLSGIFEERAFNGVNKTPRGPGHERFQDALVVGQMRRLQNDSRVPGVPNSCTQRETEDGEGVFGTSLCT